MIRIELGVLGVLALLSMTGASIAENAYRVGVFTAEPRAFSTNSYWLEGKDGLVLVDTQFLPSDALKSIEAAERTTGKKVALAVVLHANPDKFNGTEALQQRGIRVITSEQVKALIPGVHRIRTGWFYRRYAPDYPVEAPLPDAFGSASRDMEAAGVRFQLHVLGAGCSAAHVVLQAGADLFTGDLVASGTHAWLELGLVDPWLARLAELRALRPARVFPGRGPAGGPELIEATENYLRFVRQTVLEAKPEGELGFFAKGRLAAEIERAFSQLGYPNFMHDGLAEVWRQLQNARR